MKERVTVWGKPYEITVHKKSKSVWIAVGDYMDETLEVQDRSRSSAVKAWCDAAKYKGN